MASFPVAYKQYIQPNEGGYANVANDKGGETYAGIARNLNPSWQGWIYIDFKKRTAGTIAWNTKFPDIQYLVDQFYQSRWDSLRLTEVQSQELANLLFDYHVHSGTHAIVAVQRLLKITADGNVGSQTIAAINKAEAAGLHDALKEERKDFLRSLAVKDPTQNVFLAQWLARVDRFTDLASSSSGVLVIGGLLAVAATVYFFSNRQQQTKLAA